MNKQLASTSVTSQTHSKYIPRRFNRKKFLEYDKALQLDFEEFLVEFGELETCNYESFADLWVEKKIGSIFNGCSKIQEVSYLTEHSMNCAKKYVIYSDKINIQVGAFYLLYGLYYKQPAKNLIKIRITLKEIKKFQELLFEMRQLRQTDFLFIYNKLMEDDAFFYVYTQFSLGPDNALKQTELVNNIFPIDPMHVIKLFKDINEENLNKIEESSKEFDKILKEFQESEGGLKIPNTPITLKNDIDIIIDEYNNRNDNFVEIKEEGASTSQRIVKNKAFSKKIKGFRRVEAQKN